MSNDQDDDMQPEYDFRRAERGKHYAGRDAIFHVPVYLDQEVQNFLMKKAATDGVELDRLVNDLLKRDIEALQTPG